jgi:hypothetical protein
MASFEPGSGTELDSFRCFNLLISFRARAYVKPLRKMSQTSLCLKFVAEEAVVNGAFHRSDRHADEERFLSSTHVARVERHPVQMEVTRELSPNAAVPANLDREFCPSCESARHSGSPCHSVSGTALLDRAIIHYRTPSMALTMGSLAFHYAYWIAVAQE